MIGNLEYYKVFYYVAKCGGITSAAEKLSISQPAVSQAMKQLEQNISAKLFVRTAKGIRLTTEGELLFSYVEKGYEQMELGEQKLKQMLNLDLGELRIGASDMTLRFYLLPFLEIFHERYPGIKVTVTNAPTPETLQYLQNGKIDFGVVSTPFENPGNFQAIVVKEIEDVFIAGRRFIQHKNKTLDLKDLESLPLIQLEGNTSTGKYMEAYLAENGVKINPEFELATSDMIVQFVVRNLGIGCVVKDFAKKEIDSGRLFELRFNKMIPKRNFCVVSDVKNPLSAATRSLLEIIYADMEHED